MEDFDYKSFQVKSLELLKVGKPLFRMCGNLNFYHRICFNIPVNEKYKSGLVKKMKKIVRIIQMLSSVGEI